MQIWGGGHVGPTLGWGWGPFPDAWVPLPTLETPLTFPWAGRGGGGNRTPGSPPQTPGSPPRTPGSPPRTLGSSPFPARLPQRPDASVRFPPPPPPFSLPPSSPPFPWGPFSPHPSPGTWVPPKSRPVCPPQTPGCPLGVLSPVVPPPPLNWFPPPRGSHRGGWGRHVPRCG